MGDFGGPHGIVNFQSKRLVESWAKDRKSNFYIPQLPMHPCARSTLTHQLPEELNKKIPTLPELPPKKAISKKLGFRIDNPILTASCIFQVNKWFLKGNERYF